MANIIGEPIMLCDTTAYQIDKVGQKHVSTLGFLLLKARKHAEAVGYFFLGGVSTGPGFEV